MTDTRLIGIGLMLGIPQRLVRSLTVGLLAAGVWASEHHGTVQSGGLPVPGATVTAVQNDQKLVTTTDDQGRYEFANLPDGVWTIRVEMFGFVTLSREVGIAAEAPSPDWQLQVASLSAAKRDVPEHPTAAPAGPRRAAQLPEGGSPRGPGTEGRGGARGPASLRQ